MKSFQRHKLSRDSVLTALLFVLAAVLIVDSSEVVPHCDEVADQVETFLIGPQYDILKEAVNEVVNMTTTDAVASAISSYYEAGVLKPVGYSESSRYANMYHEYIIRPCKEVNEMEQDLDECAGQDLEQLEVEVEMFLDKVFFICQRQLAGGEKALRESYKTFEAILAS